MNKMNNVAEVSYLATLGSASFEKSKYTAQLCITDQENDTQAYIVEDKDTIYLTFHSDLELSSFSSKTFSSLNLNKAYWELWRDLSDQVAEEMMQRRLDMSEGITPKKRVVYCGHGIGGALATIAAATHFPDECVTFGSPPIGSSRIPTGHTAHTCYVLHTDPIPWVNFWKTSYGHLGTLVYIDGDMNAVVRPSLWTLVKLRVFNKSDINDNQMSWYKAGVWVNGDII